MGSLAGRPRLAPVLALAVALALPAPVAGQDPNRTPAQDLEDFVHYALIAKIDLAAGHAQSLIDSGITDAELASLVDETRKAQERLDDAVGWGLRHPELENLAAEVGRRVEQGRMDLARDGDRIKEAIAMLTGTQRQRKLAQARLEAAGEYAMPGLLLVITEGRDEKLRLACQNMIMSIGRQAVTPLCAALPSVDPQSQRIICDMLGEIGHPHAAAALRQMELDPAAPQPTRDAAARAFRLVSGLDRELSVLFSDLGFRYFRNERSLIAFPGEPTNNVWGYDAFVGLVPEPVPTEIYSEVMAMRQAIRALELSPANRAALALFVAANLKRENDLPEGMADPIFGEWGQTPEFYATVFGTQVCLDVLALALDAMDTPLIRDAIAALSQTTGGSNLFTASEGRQPLLEALSYPDRRVQYEAALTLAGALPSRGFSGDHRVVPLLASAVRTGNESFAILVVDDEENRRQTASRLESLGFTIVGAEGSSLDVRGAIAEAVGIDLIVVRMAQAQWARQELEALRDIPRTSAAPALVIVPQQDVSTLALDLSEDNRTKVIPPGRSDEAFTAVLDEVFMRAVGGRMTEAEAEAYAYEALGAMERIAISCTPAYSIADAEIALLEALDRRSGRARLLVAELLGLIESDAAQRALFDAALAAESGERIDLLDRVAESVKRYGDRAETRHHIALVDLIENSGGATAEAAARVLGSLNVTSTDVIRLIRPKQP